MGWMQCWPKMSNLADMTVSCFQAWTGMVLDERCGRWLYLNLVSDNRVTSMIGAGGIGKGQIWPC